ncbi:MAG: histidine phosphatase family protein [Propionibacteriaceae bacterium]|nr:histidine phosphatase family protein [Propionibacteriaceae bacterium]
MTRVIMLRHGETLWNREGKMQGQADIELSEHGREQAHEVATELSQYAFDAVWSSPLSRAVETARAVASAQGLDVHVDARLGEINMGSLAGKTWAEVSKAHPEWVERLRAGEDFRRSESGETSEEMARRGTLALHDIAAEHPDQTVLVATHGFFARVTVASLLGLSGFGRRLGTLGNAHWAELSHDDAGWTLLGYNLGGAQPHATK